MADEASSSSDIASRAYLDIEPSTNLQIKTPHNQTKTDIYKNTILSSGNCIAYIDHPSPCGSGV